MTRDEFYGIIIMLLAVTEDRATQECDLSAVYGVSGKSDAMDVVALLFCFLYTYYHSSRKPQCVKLRVRAEPDEPKLLTHQISDTPFRLRIDSLQSITRG